MGLHLSDSLLFSYNTEGNWYTEQERHIIMIQLQEDYPYLYETHLHTSRGSACGMYTGTEMAKACKAAGYTGIFVTDHNWGGNTAVPGSMPWKSWVEEFSKGYEEAKECGDRIGLDVFFGYEAGFQGTEFLIYGLDKTFLMEHPELKNATIEEQYKIVKEGGGMVIHAHPFREEYYIPAIRLLPEYVDGVEGINSCHSNQMIPNYESRRKFDESAIAYGNEHGLPLTAGSDIHFTNLYHGGIAFSRKLESGKDYARALLSGEDYLLTNGDQWFNRFGELQEER